MKLPGPIRPRLALAACLLVAALAFGGSFTCNDDDDDDPDDVVTVDTRVDV